MISPMTIADQGEAKPATIEAIIPEYAMNFSYGVQY